MPADQCCWGAMALSAARGSCMETPPQRPQEPGFISALGPPLLGKVKCTVPATCTRSARRKRWMGPPSRELAAGTCWGGWIREGTAHQPAALALLVNTTDTQWRSETLFSLLPLPWQYF